MSTCERVEKLFVGYLVANGILSFHRAAHQPITLLCIALSSTNKQNHNLHPSARPPLVQEIFVLLHGHEVNDREFILEEITLSTCNFFFYKLLN